MIGTNKSVVGVANRRPPITARPSGAFCSPPSPRPSAIGTIPMIMAKAVIVTGRIHAYPARYDDGLGHDHRYGSDGTRPRRGWGTERAARPRRNRRPSGCDSDDPPVRP